MARMTCFGAQSVVVTELTAPRPGSVMQCRRDSGNGEQRTFVSVHAMERDQPALCALQLSLFEEPVEENAD